MTKKQLAILPTYLIAKASRPFLYPSHPFRQDHITLDDWEKRATELTRIMSTILWLNTSLLVYLLIILFVRK